jgi:hypothetical protein
MRSDGTAAVAEAFTLTLAASQMPVATCFGLASRSGSASRRAQFGVDLCGSEVGVHLPPTGMPAPNSRRPAY